jgi:MoaA/NifB/PqqE/SkfB family radical SAM enzyme
MPNTELLRRMRRQWNHVRFGDQVRIDAASHCQLRCPVCQTWDLKNRVGRGYLKFHDFRRFVDRYENFRRIELSNNGEIFLNPDLARIIEYAHAKGIALTAENGVNLNHIGEDVIDALVRFGFESLNVSIDGASDATYSIYRERGSFPTVIRNIEKINARKAALGTDLPRLKWRFIVFGHNEHEIADARRMAKTLGMEFQLLSNVEAGYSPVRDPDLVAREMGFASAVEWRAAQREAPTVIWYCTGLWERIQINWDGRLLGCCVNTVPFSENVFEVGLGRAIRAKSYRRAKQMLSGKHRNGSKTICSDCGIYHDRVRRGAYLAESEFRRARRLRLQAVVMGTLRRRSALIGLRAQARRSSDHAR